MNKYLITLNGCDDITKCEIELTKNQLEIFMQIAKEINKKSTSYCEPTISVYDTYKKEEDGYLSTYNCTDLLESKGEK